MNLSPIILFVYNRYWHALKTIEALQKNDLAMASELFIFSDGAKNDLVLAAVNEVRNYVKSIKGFKKVTVIEREKNVGLANNIINGVSEIVNKYGKAIVLEDDLITSAYFLNYMNNALEFYKDNEKVISIHGYVYPVKENMPETFFIKGADCWGWATWKRGWDQFEVDGSKLLNELKARKLCKEFDYNNSYPYTQMLKDQVAQKNNSWAIRWYASAFLNNKLTLYPGNSLVGNIGNDMSGTHSESTNAYDVKLVNVNITKFDELIEENLIAKKVIENYFKRIIRNAALRKFFSFVLLRWK